MTQTDRTIYGALEADAQEAPVPLDPASQVARIQWLARRRRRTSALATAGIAASIVVVTACGALVLSGASGSSSGDEADSAAMHVAEGAAGSAVFADTDGAASCVVDYSPHAVATSTSFAFDGTVTSVGTSLTNNGTSADIEGLVSVTFTVNAWLQGGSAESITVDMPAPEQSEQASDETATVNYGVGSRLLVSGNERWPEDGATDDLIAWTGCGGFTLYYSDGVAESWADAIAGFAQE